MFLFLTTEACAQEIPGSIRGSVADKDFDAPLAAAQVTIVETGEKAMTSDEGAFVFGQVPPGTYTIVFTKDGYARQAESNVVVTSGRMTEVSASLPGEFTEMEEFVVQELHLGGTETGLLMLRVQSPALLDSISSELISKAGAGDAASALRLVAGATIQDGKYAVIRGLPDRYVNSQMNGVRLPTADASKRAVQLDQFPSEIIESVQVSKTFTPDQQGDASGGAVNLVLKGIPEKATFKAKVGTSWNSQVPSESFLTYEGGGVGKWGKDDGRRAIQTDNIGRNWNGAVGVSRESAPENYNGAVSGGGKHKFDTFDVTVGAFASAYYKEYSSYYDNGKNDKLYGAEPGKPMVPVVEGTSGDQKTSLFDITQGTQGVQLGGLGVLGAAWKDQSIDLLKMSTRMTEDTATLSEDTRGKSYFYPGFDVNNPYDPGNQNQNDAPWLRAETLTYTERTTDTLQWKGKHKIPTPDVGFHGLFVLTQPQLDWTVARSTSGLDQPDKRMFGSEWQAESGFIGWGTSPSQYVPYKPRTNFTMGNFQRIWKEITEDSKQNFWNLKFPFKQWSDDEGYLKVGKFSDKVYRAYNQDTFTNLNDNPPNNMDIGGTWDVYWSSYYLDGVHPIVPVDVDVDYTAVQKINAEYYMVDLPLTHSIKLIGGMRYERTQLNIKTSPESDVEWIAPGEANVSSLDPGEGDVSFNKKNRLPSFGFVYTPFKKLTLRGSYSETVARQTFKELTPIMQMEYLGGDVFIGNPELKMSWLKNRDLRMDYTPYYGGLCSVSYFEKYVRDPIEYVLRMGDFPYTYPVNYPEGRLNGMEFEVRQDMGRVMDILKGFSVGANATFIKSQVRLPDDEIIAEGKLAQPKRDMTNAPSYLYNLYATYDLERLGTSLGLFYTVRGDTLIAGASGDEFGFAPNVYETKYGTLNFSLGQKLGKNFKLVFQAKNLLNPKIRTVYRSQYIPGDTVKSSYTKGIDYSLSINGEW